MAPLTMQERQHILDQYKGLRVADVRDGLDWLLLHDIGTMTPDIKPLFRTRIAGFARTYRYVPYTGDIPQMTPEEYGTWAYDYYYKEVAPVLPGMEEELQDDDVVVVDADDIDAGLIGSNSGLWMLATGARGVITSGGIRDTDECLLNKIPCWFKLTSQKMNQGRIQYEDRNIPITVGGVHVRPDDFVVADGDGVIVVPREHILDVALWANREMTNDKAGRRRAYERLGMPLDETVS